MKHAAHRSRRMLAAGLWLFFLGLIFYVFLLPVLARWQVLSTLRSIDAHASVVVRHVSPGRLQLSDVTLGDAPWFRADEIAVTFGSLGLLGGRVETVTVRGAEWRILVRDGAVDLGFSTDPSAGNQGALDGAIERLELHDAEIVLDAGDRTFHLSVEGTLIENGPHEQKLSIRARGFDLVSFARSAALHSGALQLEAIIRRGEIAQLHAQFHAPRIEVPGLTLRDAKVQLTQTDNGSLVFQASASGQDLRRITLEGVMPSFPDLLDRQAGWSASATLEASVGLPADVRNWLHERGVVARVDEPIDCSSLVVFRLGKDSDRASPSWSLELASGRAEISGCSVVLPDLGIELLGITGQLAFEGRVDTDDVSVRFLAGSGLSVQRIDGDEAGISARTVNADGSLTTLTVGPDSCLVSVATDALATTWRVSGPLHLRLLECDLAVAPPSVGALTAERLEVQLDVEISADPTGLVVSQGGGGSLIIGSLTSDHRGVSISGPLRAILDSIGDDPLLTIPSNGEGWCAALGIHLTDTVSIDTKGARGTVGRLELTGRVYVNEDQERILDATAIIADASAYFPAADLAFQGITATLPLAIGKTEEKAGSFTVADVARKDGRLGSIEGRIVLQDKVAAVTADIELVGGVHVSARGQLGAGESGLSGAFDVECGRFTIRDPAEFARLLGLPAGVQLGGTLSMVAEVTIDGSNISPRARLELIDVNLELPGEELEIMGANGVVVFDRLWPLSTPGGQRLTLGPARLGRIGIQDAVIDFTLQGPAELLIESARWTTDDEARFATAAFRFDPLAPVISTTLYAEGLSLDYWLPLLTDGRATGEGKLNGRVPFIIRPPRIWLGPGYFHSTPGGGRITVADAGGLDELLEQSDPRFGTDENMQILKQRLIEALRDFRYDTLQFDLLTDRHGTMLRAFTSGRGLRGEHPQEIGGLTVNVPNIDVVLSQLLSLRSALDHPADRSLERFFDD